MSEILNSSNILPLDYFNLEYQSGILGAIRPVVDATTDTPGVLGIFVDLSLGIQAPTFDRLSLSAHAGAGTQVFFPAYAYAGARVNLGTTFVDVSKTIYDGNWHDDSLLSIGGGFQLNSDESFWPVLMDSGSFFRIGGSVLIPTGWESNVKGIMLFISVGEYNAPGS